MRAGHGYLLFKLLLVLSSKCSHGNVPSVFIQQDGKAANRRRKWLSPRPMLSSHEGVYMRWGVQSLDRHGCLIHLLFSEDSQFRVEFAAGGGKWNVMRQRSGRQQSSLRSYELAHFNTRFNGIDLAKDGTRREGGVVRRTAGVSSRKVWRSWRMEKMELPRAPSTSKVERRRTTLPWQTSTTACAARASVKTRVQAPRGSQAASRPSEAHSGRFSLQAYPPRQHWTWIS